MLLIILFFFNYYFARKNIYKAYCKYCLSNTKYYDIVTKITIHKKLARVTLSRNNALNKKLFKTVFTVNRTWVPLSSPFTIIYS